MKEEYKQPTVTVLKLKPRTSILAYSYGGGIEGTETIEEPGGEGDYA